MFEVIFLIAIVLYFAQVVVFSIAIKKKYEKVNDSNLPTASVIVAARNEEDNILNCLNSLAQSDYPKDKFEVIVVDDYSTDNTFTVVKEFIKDKPNFKIIKTEKQFGNIKGKANAISNAIEIASGEIILTTDADCVVSPQWVRTLTSYYADESVAVVCGYTNQNDDTNFAAMQSMDFMYLMSVAAGTMNLGKPTSCIGNNMSYRKNVYNEVGGYENLPFSVTEDFQLLMAIDKLKKYKIIYPLDAGGLVTSKACETPKALYWQKKRWGVGGLDARPFAFMVVFTGWFVHGCILLSPLFMSLNVFYLTFFKFLMDYYLLKPLYNLFNIKFKLKHFILFEIYFIVYTFLLPLLVFTSQRIIWKDRVFK